MVPLLLCAVLLVLVAMMVGAPGAFAERLVETGEVPDVTCDPPVGRRQLRGVTSCGSPSTTFVVARLIRRSRNTFVANPCGDLNPNTYGTINNSLQHPWYADDPCDNVNPCNLVPPDLNTFNRGLGRAPRPTGP
ncbi:MAG TPA: hypothetical protein VE197_03480 [Mycobacterium sp.]|nr:hypothetical protein [Mycobacterium sp.]